MVNQLESSLASKNSQAKQVTNLQNLIFPKLDICTVEELFFRADSKVLFNYENNKLELNKGGIVSFDAYFNIFCVETWKAYTNVRSINACLQLKGTFKVKILNIDTLGETKTVLYQKIITSINFDEVTVLENLDISPYTGVIYIEIEALEKNCQVSGGYFYSYAAQQDSNIKFALVICTYKREAYVYKNITLLEKYLLNQDNWKDKLEVFIIDNGKTLDNFDSSIIHLIPNKNAGGSGGFSRGMLEVLQRQEEFSHIILMDDDVLFEPETFDRLWNFITVRTDNNLCIGGSMFRLDKKFIQHERGGYWNKNKGCIPVKHNIDLKNTRNILFNEIEEYFEYNAWWLFCCPTSVVKDFGLAYPFFIRLDDVEFSKRIQKKIINLNGVCVWHEQFESKHSPATEYYNTRNGMILNTLYLEKFSSVNVIKWFVKPVFQHLFCYRYETAGHILKATADFINGPYALVAGNPEEKHKEISKVVEKPTKNPELPFIYSKYQESVDQQENTLHRFWRILTLNGHLLPSWFFFQDETFIDKGYKIVPSWGSRPINVFRAKRILYYNLQVKEGFVVKFSRIKFFQILANTIWLALVVLFKFPQVKREYINSLPEFTKPKFWEKYLEIEKNSN